MPVTGMAENHLDRKGFQPLNILFVQSGPCVRNYKECRALSSRGHRVSLAFSQLSHEQSLPCFRNPYRETFRVETPSQLWDLSAGYDLVHCHNPPDIWCAVALAGPRPVIHDSHDMVSLTGTADSSGAYLEEMANRGATGRVYVSSYMFERARRSYHVAAETSIILSNYPGVEMLPRKSLEKLFSLDGRAHLVYEGHLSDQVGKITYLLPFFQRLTAMGLHVHLHPLFEVPLYREAASRTDDLHYYDPLPPQDLLLTLSRYDYGLIPYSPNQFNRRHLDSALPNKLFDYLAAGLSVLSENIESLRQFLSSREAGVVYDRVGDIPSLLKDLARLQPVDSEEFTMEKAIPELERLYALVLERDS